MRSAKNDVESKKHYQVAFAQPEIAIQNGFTGSSRIALRKRKKGYLKRLTSNKMPSNDQPYVAPAWVLATR
jgi:hypothetical protein